MVGQKSLPPAPPSPPLPLHLEMVVARIWEYLLGQGVENRKSKGRDLKRSHIWRLEEWHFFPKQLLLSLLSG